MQGFQHKYGDQPLEGYTIHRAVGRGGFGEVYYAVSTSGREVALKTLQGYEQIELRGVSQCMNLKSPHLVTIFDIKHNDQDKPFVIMEYVAGPSLRELLDDSPSGLGTQKAAFFLREIAKGLTFLHDRGIVHRDLKPGNIFYEDGYVKIGDYGLSKAISASQHSAQTITVGTVHYMAPEIGKGQYDRGIDVYALGVLLYEMLTGHVPFFGASHGEILMKHLMDVPDLSGVEEPFATVIRKAMAKEPADRYQSAQEMVEAIFGAEHIQQSVSHFSPESLSVVAERAAKKVAVGGPGSSAEHGGRLDAGRRPTERGSSDIWQDFATRLDWVGDRVVQAGSRLRHRLTGVERHRRAVLPGQPAEWEAAAGRDPITDRQRRRLAAVVALALGIGAAVASGNQMADPDTACMIAILAIAGASVGILLGRRVFLKSHRPGSGNAMTREGAHIICVLLACGFTLLLAGPLALVASEIDGARVNEEAVFGTLGVVLISILFLPWIKLTAPIRRQRVSLRFILLAGILGLIWVGMFDGTPELAVGILVGIVMTVQISSPFDPEASRVAASVANGQRHLGRRRHDATPESGDPGLPDSPAREADAPAATYAARAEYARASRSKLPVRIVPPWVRAIALLAALTLLGVGLVLLIWAGLNEPHVAVGKYMTRYQQQGRPIPSNLQAYIHRWANEEFVLAICFGIGSLLLSLFAFVKALTSKFRSWWGSFFKPVLMLACVQTVVTAGVYLGNMSPYLQSDDEMIALFLIIFPSILFFVIAFIPNHAVRAVYQTTLGRLVHREDAALLEGQVSPATDGAAESGQAEGPKTAGWRQFCMPMMRMSDVTSVLRSSSAAIDKTTHFVLTMLGVLLVVGGFAIGLFVAADVPGLIEAGVPEPGLAEELTRDFGYAGWPKLLRQAGTVCAGLALLLGTGIWIAARRRTDRVHIVRVPIGVGGLAYVLERLSVVFRRLDLASIVDLVNSNQPAPAAEAFFNAILTDPGLEAGGWLLASIVLLVWPARRPRPATAATDNEGA